jgi:hypothetical protein
MTKWMKFQRSAMSIRRFGFSDFKIFVAEFVSDFDSRISDLFRWLFGKRQILEVLVTNISKGRVGS